MVESEYSALNSAADSVGHFGGTVDPLTGQWIPEFVKSKKALDLENVKLSEQEVAALFRKWRGDAVCFVQEVLGVDPSEQQAELLTEASKPGAKVSVSSGHGTGKTTSLAWLVLWFLLFRSNVKVPCTAPSKSQLKDVLWAELGKWYAKLPGWWKEQVKVLSERVEIVGSEATRFAVARTARKENPDALQGFHADNLLFLIDEAAGVNEKIFEVARGALSTESAGVVMCANPTQLTGYFFNSHHKNRDSWTRLVFDCEKSPLVSPKYALDMAKEYGRDSDVFRVRVQGLFPRQAFNQLISLNAIEAALERKVRPENISFAPKILGVDVAPYGGDRSTIVLRQGIYSKLLFKVVGMDDITFAGKVIEYGIQYNVDATFIDKGAGSGVISACESLNFPVTGIFFQGKSGDEKYINKRSEMWVKMRDWMSTGAIEAGDQADDLRDDLLAPQYFYTATGKLQLERKEDIRKRGLASPDLADALALTFALPVTPKYAQRASNTPEVANSEYRAF